MLKPHIPHMEAAVNIAETKKSAFGAALAMGDELFVTAWNDSKQLNDTSRHAPAVAIQKLKEHLQKNDLSGFTLYSTCEPCRACKNVVKQSGIETVFFGVSQSDYKEIAGSHQDMFSSMENGTAAFGIKFTGNVLNAKCTKLLNRYG